MDDDRRSDPTVQLLEDFVRQVSEEVVVPPFSPGGRRAVPGPRVVGSRRLLAGVAVSLVVVAAVAVAVAYGPHSSGNRPPTAPGGAGPAVATFLPVRSSASTRQLNDDADHLTRRLHHDGDFGATAVVHHHTIVVVGGTRLPVPASELVVPGTLQIRPALCASAPYTASANIEGRALPGACSAGVYSLKGPNLLVATATGTSNVSSIPLDPVLAGHPSSTAGYDDSHPADPVLVPLVGGGGERYLLAPAGLDGSAVAAAAASSVGSQWTVDVDLTARGAVQWDSLAQRNFHEILAIDLDGRVISAPLVEPTQSTFTSFAGRLTISGNLSRRSALNLADVLNSGPLVTPLRPAS